MKEIIAIFIGGGIGSTFRYLLQVGINHLNYNGSFPWPTWIANIMGCFLIGAFYAWSSKFNWNIETKLLLTTGLCGGFTTFSTFCNESLQLVRNGNYMLFTTYLLASIIIGIAAVFIGNNIMK